MVSDYKDPRWQRLRLLVMDRDNWACVHCGDCETTLHVHHKVYCGKPWESSMEDLQTLCESCHDLLGPHPRGGVWWTGKGGFCCVHCPKCGGHNFKEKGSFDKCIDCGERVGQQALYGWQTFDRYNNKGAIDCSGATFASAWRHAKARGRTACR